MYDGGTKVDDIAPALNAKATLSLQKYCTRKTIDYVKGQGQETAEFHYPLGVRRPTNC